MPPQVDPVWHAQTADAVLAHWGCDPAQGLTAAAVDQRTAAHGPNALPEPPKPAAWRLWLRQFKSPLIYILLVAAVLALALGHHTDALVIVAVVIVNAAVGALQEGRAERSMGALRKLSALQVRVLRDGQEQRIESRALVPGDLLLLAAGDAIGADARIVDETALQVAEAALTGESVPVAKAVPPLPEATPLADRHDMLFAGTFVTAGRARAVVVATGPHTEVGRIARLTEQAVEPKTPLQLRLERFGRWLVGAALGLFVIVLVLGVARQLPLAELLMVAISQMVSMVPEGLPVAMTIALAVGMQRMAARRAIIRRLSAVETLGSTTVICSDKTGTLTRNEMMVAEAWLPHAGARVFTGSGYAPSGELHDADGRPVPPDAALHALLAAGVLCNDAELLPPEGERTAWSVLGDPTEGALLVAAVKGGLDIGALRRAWPRDGELPFDSERRVMVTRHRDGSARQRDSGATTRTAESDAARAATGETVHAAGRDAPDATVVFIKGAPEAVLRLCGGEPALQHAARAAADAMAQRALRVLAVARVAGASWSGDADLDALTGRATLLGLVGQIDPPRDEARAAVQDCRRAGIRPVMVTGDHKLTGLAISRQLGIARDGDLALDGTELERMGEADLADRLDRIAVFARVQPAQKLRIVEALQARGEVVAMTGDGVNDAPALARADVGVAMGITGTEVAKSAARIVITDDNFATLVGAVEQGRVVYANLKKVILYLFATSIDEVVLLLLALLAGLPLPLLAVQILWINIVTEGTLTVNLVMDPPEGDEMRRPPVPRDDPLLDRGMRARIALMALTTVAVCATWFAARLHAGVALEQVRTEVFTLLAVAQWFNVLNCESALRSALRGGVVRNRWLLAGLAASVGLQFAVLYVPLMNQLFHTVPLPPADLLPLLAAASAVLWVEEARKLVARRRAAPLNPRADADTAAPAGP